MLENITDAMAYIHNSPSPVKASYLLGAIAGYATYAWTRVRWGKLTSLAVPTALGLATQYMVRPMYGNESDAVAAGCFVAGGLVGLLHELSSTSSNKKIAKVKIKK